MVGRTLHNISVLISHIGTLGAIKNILCGKRAQQESLKWPNTCFNTELRYVIPEHVIHNTRKRYKKNPASQSNNLFMCYAGM